MKTINDLDELNKILSSTISGGFENIDLSDTIIKCDFELVHKKIQLANFENTLFEGVVTFLNCQFEESVSFKNAVFNGKVNFNGSIFNLKVRFLNTVFKDKSTFNNTRFNNLVDFWKAKFYFPTVFYKTDFSNVVVFSYTQFLENVLFTYSTFEGQVIFQSTKFKKGVDLSLAVIAGELNVFDITIERYISVNDIEDEDVYEDFVIEKALITLKNKRETYRILKKALRDRSNNIDALEFQYIENQAFYMQLKSRIKKRNSFIKTIPDFVIFLLNKVSNRHGKSWARGAAFTIIVGWLFFYLALLNTEKFNFTWTVDCETFNKGLKYYVEFMLPTHKIDFLQNEIPSSGSYLWDFFGRLFVSFGIYQTIQAFRKFRSNI